MTQDKAAAPPQPALQGHKAPSHPEGLTVDPTKLGKPVGLLSITAVQCKDLHHSSLLSRFDALEPFLVASLNHRPANPALVSERPLDATEIDTQYQVSQRTRKSPGENPIWNEKIYFVIYNKLDRVFIDVYDKDWKGHDEMGQTIVDLSSESQSVEWIKDLWLPLHDAKGNKRKESQVQLIVHFEPVTVADYLQKKLNRTIVDIKSDIAAKIVNSVLDQTKTGAQAYLANEKANALEYGH
ncbi:hypothetical protein HDV00_003991 [Rhizophlyctis rosea]|nr:hypothetical protein HDV00_003991 [Rhizophlyctis rosea]